MSKEKSKVTPVEGALAWIAKHAEATGLEALNAAVTDVVKRTTEVQELVIRLGALLDARKQAVKVLKQALKTAKANRKHPQSSAPVKKSLPKKAAPPKAGAKKAAPPKPELPS